MLQPKSVGLAEIQPQIFLKTALEISVLFKLVTIIHQLISGLPYIHMMVDGVFAKLSESSNPVVFVWQLPEIHLFLVQLADF